MNAQQVNGREIVVSNGRWTVANSCNDRNCFRKHSLWRLCLIYMRARWKNLPKDADQSIMWHLLSFRRKHFFLYRSQGDWNSKRRWLFPHSLKMKQTSLWELARTLNRSSLARIFSVTHSDCNRCTACRMHAPLNQLCLMKCALSSTSEFVIFLVMCDLTTFFASTPKYPQLLSK